ncbi:uncharacterized protein [Haliotis asinina]|uniref:uncharacterized protein n=1 Tax=Haliotis asinina TaxID=109174 RepID=UPI0035323439
MLPPNFVETLKKEHPHMVKRVAELLEYNGGGFAIFGRSLATTLNLPSCKPPDILQCDVLIVTRKCLPIFISFASEAFDGTDKYNADLARRMRVILGKYTAERFNLIFLATEEKLYLKKITFHSTVQKRKSMVIESCFSNQKYMNDSKFEGLKNAVTATVSRTRIPMHFREREAGAFWVLMKEQFSLLLDNVDLQQPLDVPESLPGKTVFMFEAAQRLERSGKTLLICDNMEEKTKRNHAPDEVTIETIESFLQSRQDLTPFKHIMVSATHHKLEAIQDKLKAVPTPIWRIFERDVHTKPLSVVLLGYARTGKSLLANTIAGEKLFEAGLFKPTTMCQQRRTSVGTRTIHIMDTPGFSLHNRQYIKTTAEQLVSKASSTDAFLLVVKARQMTYEEMLLFKYVRAIAGKSMSRKIILVFTTLDDNITLEGYLENTPSFLEEFLQLCHNPPVLVNVGTQSERANDQIQDLFRAIGKIQSTPFQEPKMNKISQKLTAAICELEKYKGDANTTDASNPFHTLWTR